MPTAKKHHRSDDANAFIKVPEDMDGPIRSDDDLAEEFGENFVTSATTAEPVATDVQNDTVPEEEGGPFVETDAGTEFATDTDPSNPEDAERAPLPTPMRGM